MGGKKKSSKRLELIPHPRGDQRFKGRKLDSWWRRTGFPSCPSSLTVSVALWDACSWVTEREGRWEESISCIIGSRSIVTEKKTGVSLETSGCPCQRTTHQLDSRPHRNAHDTPGGGKREGREQNRRRQPTCWKGCGWRDSGEKVFTEGFQERLQDRCVGFLRAEARNSGQSQTATASRSGAPLWGLFIDLYL